MKLFNKYFRGSTVENLARNLASLEVHILPYFKSDFWFNKYAQLSLDRSFFETDGKSFEHKQKLETFKTEEKCETFQKTLNNPTDIFIKNIKPAILCRIKKLADINGEEYRYARRHQGIYQNCIFSI